MIATDRAAALRLMAFDVDGVLTDGTLYFGGDEEIKGFSVRDGHGIKMLADSGVEVAIITGRRSRAVELRAANLGVSRLFQDVADKRACMAELARDRGLDLAVCGYMGDDVVDLPVLRACGFSATVPDGHALVRQHVLYVSQAPAGYGAAREVCEFILRAAGKLDGTLAGYLG